MHESLPAFLSFLSEPRLLVAAATLAVGVLFGALAESSQFCLLGGLRDTAEGAGRSRLAAFGAAALAALLSGAWRAPAGARIGIVLCGANCDPGSVA